MPPSRRSKPVLIVEDDETTHRLLTYLLKQDGISSRQCGSVSEALAVNPTEFEMAIIDLGLPDGDGSDLLRHFKRLDPDLPLLVLTARDQARDVVDAMRAGASDYLTKPFDRAELLASIGRARASEGEESASIRRAGRPGPSKRTKPLMESFPSPAMRPVTAMLDRAARSDVPVLITGETGCGKGVLAHEIHRLSHRAEGPLQLVTCPAIPRELAETEFFGHERGSFTGAVGSRKGRIEAADGGTLFLDEIGDLQPSIQPKLLEVLQSGSFTRVGGNTSLHSDFRLISATNISLAEAVAARTFREDLLFRINLFEIRVPCLRERPEDIPLLCQAILARLAPPPDRETWELDPKLLEWFATFHWPGNIRQLENVLGRMTLVSTTGRLGIADLPIGSLLGEDSRIASDGVRAALSRGQALEDIERVALIAALESSGGNRGRAARLLGVSLRTVYNMIDRFGLPKQSPKDSRKPPPHRPELG